MLVAADDEVDPSDSDGLLGQDVGDIQSSISSTHTLCPVCSRFMPVTKARIFWVHGRIVTSLSLPKLNYLILNGRLNKRYSTN